MREYRQLGNNRRAIKLQDDNRRREYGISHPFCWRPRERNGVWRLDWEPFIHVHHIAGRGVGYEVEDNWISLGGPSGCHIQWAERQGKPEELQPEIDMRLFAVKVIMGEADPGVVMELMRRAGRTWWDSKKDGDITFEEKLAKYVEEMDSIRELDIPRWETWKEGK
jgi:hypothetical protein